MMPEFQRGEPLGLSHDVPHSVVVCGRVAPLKSQTTVSPWLTVVSQTLPSNDSLQNQRSPTAMVPVSCACAGRDAPAMSAPPRASATMSSAVWILMIGSSPLNIDSVCLPCLGDHV